MSRELLEFDPFSTLLAKTSDCGWYGYFGLATLRHIAFPIDHGTPRTMIPASFPVLLLAPAVAAAQDDA